MKIVHCIKTLDFVDGGPVRAIIDLSATLAERGHEVRILTLRDPDAPTEWRESSTHNPRTIPLGPMHRKGTSLSPEQRGRVTEAIRWCDIAHVHGIWQPLTLRVSSVARRMHKPYIISLRGMLDDWSMAQRTLKKRLYLAMGGSAMLNNADAIHCTADGEKAQSSKWFPRTEGVVIPNLLDLAPFQSLPGPDRARDRFPLFGSGEPVLLFLSRIHYKKGIEHVIDAVARLRDENAPHRLLIAGDGDKEYTRSLRNQVERLSLGDRVAFLGLVTGEDKVSLYEAADLFVLPTSQENFGFVLYESLASGTPILTTKGVDTWPELEREAGAIVCEQDGRSLARVIKGCTSDPDALAALGAKGRSWIFESMHPDRVIERFESLYDRAVSGS